MAASFRLINNTDADLPLANSSSIPRRGTRIVTQITLEIARLEQVGKITVVRLGLIDGDSALVPDYVGTVDPNAGVITGGTGGGSGTGTGSNDLGALDQIDGSVPEFSTTTSLWHSTTAPRKLVLDGGNF